MGAAMSERVARAPRGSRGHGAKHWRGLLALAAVVVICATLLGLFSGLLYLRSLPSVADAQARASALMAAHHERAVGPVPPRRLALATIAVEDARFYSDPGVDVISLGHGAWGYLTTGSTQVAGATISEQLAKLLYVRDQQSLAGKAEMIGLALKLNQRYSKAQILDMYLNIIYYGDGQYGAWQASETYFGVPPDQLDWAQASLLAGIPNAPSLLEPRGHFTLAKARQAHVLARLVAIGALTQAQADDAAREPLTIH